MEEIMAIDIDIVEHNDYLQIIVTGVYDLNKAINKSVWLL